jgi:hypothetical protein
VVVDDQLPIHGNDNTLKFCRNTRDECEMYAPLLEKAYAKVNGCYEFLDGGDIVDALIDMTGGVHERIKMQNQDQEEKDKKLSINMLWIVLLKAFDMKSLAGASSNTNSPMSSSISNGISSGHAYSVLDAFELIQPPSTNSKITSYRKSYEDEIETNQKNVRLVK